MNKRKYILPVLIVGICSIVVYCDTFNSEHYLIRKTPKFILFLLIPLLYAYQTGGWKAIRSIFTFRLQKGPVSLGSILFVVFLTTFTILYLNIDFTNLSQLISHNINGHIWLYLLATGYITLVNSFLEELFFRYFSFSCVKEHTGRNFAYLFSASMFTLYHITILNNLFDLFLTLPLLLCLLISGFILCYLQEKYRSVSAPWIVHIFANLGINTAGLLVLLF